MAQLAHANADHHGVVDAGRGTGRGQLRLHHERCRRCLHRRGAAADAHRRAQAADQADLAHTGVGRVRHAGRYRRQLRPQRGEGGHRRSRADLAADRRLLPDSAVQSGAFGSRRPDRRRRRRISARARRRAAAAGTVDARTDHSNPFIVGRRRSGAPALPRHHGVAEPVRPRRPEGCRLPARAWADHYA